MYNNYNPKQHIRSACKLGDFELIASLFPKRDGILQMGQARKMGWFMIFSGFVKFMRTLLAFTLSVPFRYHWGSKTIGLLCLYLGATWMIIFNSAQLPWLVKPIVWISSPFWLITKWNELPEFALNVHSGALLVFTGLFIAFGTVHLLISWIRPIDDTTRRGHSFLLLPLKRFKRNFGFMVALLECTLTVLTGYLFFTFYGDSVFFVYCCLSAFSLLTIEIQDKSAERQMSD